MGRVVREAGLLGLDWMWADNWQLHVLIGWPVRHMYLQAQNRVAHTLIEAE